MSRLIRPVSYLVKVLGIFLIFVTLLAFADAVNYLSFAQDYGILGYDDEWSKDSDSTLVITYVMKNYPAYSAGVTEGDTIVKFNGQKLNHEVYNKVQNSPLIGNKLTLTVKHGGIEKDYELTYVEAPVYDRFIELLFRIIPALLMLAYTLVGFWGMIKSPYSGETLLIALFCYCFGSFMYGTISFGVNPDTFVSKYLYFNQIKIGVRLLSFFATSFWLYLFATFPYRLNFLDRNKIISYIFIFLLPILVLVSAVSSLKPNSSFILFLGFLNMVLGALLLKNNTKKVRSALELRQIRLMFLGIKYGAIAILIGWATVFLTEFVLPKYFLIIKYIGLTVFLAGEVGGLIIPFTFLNSFFQNKLLETEGALKKRIRYIGVTVAMLVLYLSIIFLVGRVWIGIFNITDPTLIIVFVLLISLTFTPFSKKILKWLDDVFYPERTRYSDSLKQFLQNVSGYIESGELLQNLTLWIRNTLGISQIIPVVLDHELGLHLPFGKNEQNSIIDRIRNGTKFFWDEITDRSRIPVNHDELEWAKDNDISLTIPMISQGELLGLLNVGKKGNAEDYTSEDLDILTQASNQTALALQNIKLQTHYIEKKRMDRELEMARNIQKQLMPQELPQVKGLDVYGGFNPCKEVAGDYFDIIPMDNDFTAIVLADVSGKGAGAAMLMANLQASIRLGIHLSDKLTDFVSRVNELIYSNTSPFEFITFFMALWEPKRRELYYVNAGHNPPILIDGENKITMLDATGLVLGVLPNQEYEIKHVKIDKGSVLVVYTDGLEEAMNEKNEQFGLERMIKSTLNNKNLSSTDIASALNSEVIKYCDKVPLHDDMTLVIAKGI
jgi:serine phosphatase RsbU (regulator of sigma subunit)